MIRIYLILVVLLLVFWLLRKFLRTPPQVLVANLKAVIMTVLVLALLVLAGSGRLNWLFALTGVAAAGLFRSLPMLLRYAPQLQKLWSWFKFNRQQAAGQQSHRRTAGTGMSRKQALDILGIKEGATRAEITAAHRRLMQRNHPDRGGSDYIAAQINEAKKRLLGS